MKKLFAILTISFAVACFAGNLTMDFKREAVSLNGVWEMVVGQDSLPLWQQGGVGDSLQWKKQTVPSGFLKQMPKKEKAKISGVWIRRVFLLSPGLAQKDAILKWNNIRFGATAWINGKEIGTHPTMGPCSFPLQPGLLKEGLNQIVLNVPGWARVPKSASGYPLIPTGSNVTGWGRKNPGVEDDIWIEFYQETFISTVLAIPDLEKSQAIFRGTVSSVRAVPEDVELTVTLTTPEGESVPGARTPIELDTTTGSFEYSLDVEKPQLWSPQSPNLYQADVALSSRGRILDKLVFHFGMRSIEVKDGHYLLNGDRLWLRGSNLVAEWLWDGPIKEKPWQYLVHEARSMKLNCFRTHTLPPPTSWLDIADKNGIMFLAEFPVLFNNRDFKFTPEEWKIWHANVLLDAQCWIPKLWNHPSIIMWVLSNESRIDGKWEAGPYRDLVRALDPTRPTMRAGHVGKPHGTAENADLHVTQNYCCKAEGNLNAIVAKAAAKKDSERALTNTEYMNLFGNPKKWVQRWLGNPDHPDKDFIRAEFLAEHTEAMRRAKFDAILPYMYARWTRLNGNKWRNDFPTPASAALHSTMSPIFASLDLFDRNFLAGSTVKTPLHIFNETKKREKVVLDIYVAKMDPYYIPADMALDDPAWHTRMKKKLRPETTVIEEIEWPVPPIPGTYYLAAVLSRKGEHAPVVSQRVVRAVTRPNPSAALRGRKVALWGADPNLQSWLTRQGVAVNTTDGSVIPASDILIIPDFAEIDSSQRNSQAVLEYVQSGRRLLILRQSNWDWKEVADFAITAFPSKCKKWSSRAFAYAENAWLMKGIKPEELQRWNGIPGTIANAVVTPPISEPWQKLLWMHNPKHTIAMSKKVGEGEIVVCLLHVCSRIDPGAKNYDPVAEQLLANLLAADIPGH